MSSFTQGLIFGFGIAVPVGPIGMLCLRRSVNDGRLTGLISGLGAATADALYGIVAALGLTAVTDILLRYQQALHLVGGLFLIGLGLLTFRAKPSGEAARTPTPTGLLSAYLTVFLLTLSNPMTIITFLGFFTFTGVTVATPNIASSLLLVLGVFLGSATWWVILSFTAGALRHRLQTRGLRFLNIFSGLIITAFGVWQLAQFRL
ncbi:MAG: LysE family transporter [Verrucomicrobia bacterium]|nr:LysE family transporter [Verrucomicrobiota bacterium]